MKIFSLFANTVLTVVGEAPLDTPLAWSFVTYITILVTKEGIRAVRLWMA